MITFNTDVSVSSNIYLHDVHATGNVETIKLLVDTTMLVGQAVLQSTVLPNTIAQFSANSENYVQINEQNLNGNGSVDYVATADIGNDTDYFIDMGYLGSKYVPGAYNNLGTASNPLDGYLIVQGSTIGQMGGNLVIGTTTTDYTTHINFVVD